MRNMQTMGSTEDKTIGQYANHIYTEPNGVY